MTGMKTKLCNILLQNADTLSRKTAFAGFDGFVDSIMRVVKNRDNSGEPDYFSTMAEFGTHVIEKQNMSCSVELVQMRQKLGGNAPIMSNALGCMNINVTCVGALGYPEINAAFKGMPENCKLCGITDPGLTTALEFDDGKIMMSQTNIKATWEGVKEIIGARYLSELFCNVDLLGMVNWSEIPYTTSLWEGVLNDALQDHTPNKDQIMLFDLSDFSKRTKDDITYAVRLIEQFAHHYNVTLGLNENEARLLYATLVGPPRDMGLYEAGSRLFKLIDIDRLLIHPTRYALGWDKAGTYRVDNVFIEKPVLSTGGGDNFNAGFCLGALLGMDTEMSLHAANNVSGFYVSHGYSPNIDQLISYLQE